MRSRERKAAILKTSKRWLVNVLKDNITLPDDVKIHFISDDPATDTVDIILKSDVFETVMEGMVPPYLDAEPEWNTEDNDGS